MIRHLFLALTMLFFLPQNAFAIGVNECVDKYFAPFSDAFSNLVFTPIVIGNISVPVIILFLILSSIFFTFYLRLIGIWGFKHSLKQLFGKYHKEHDNDRDGEVSSMGAFATALSGTVGLGNIAGVAIAISIGGPGAMFWMAFGAICGMASKFLECTLAVKYRRFNPDGSVSGGPMFYIAHGLTRKGLRWLGQPLALIFALMCVPGALGGGNMLQINQATQQVINITGGQNSFFVDHAWVFGLIVAIIVGLIIVGGIKSIANVTSKIVPIMCGIYLVAAIAIIIVHFNSIPSAIATIFREAFFPQSVTGGIIGTIIIGFRRSVQSNEAGSGSAPIAYAAVKTKEPVSQGFVSLMEPFLDTVVICSITAFVIIITGEYLNYREGITGVQLTSAAFAGTFPFFPYVLAVVIILFAISTIISWAYYGQKAWSYLFGEGFKRTKVYQIMFCVFIVIGSSMNLQSVIDFTDSTMLAMAAPNLIAIFILLPEIKQDLIDYCKRYKMINAFNKPWFKNEKLS